MCPLLVSTYALQHACTHCFWIFDCICSVFLLPAAVPYRPFTSLACARVVALFWIFEPIKKSSFFLIILLFILFTRFSAYRNKRTNEIYILCRQFACARDLYRRRKAITEWERKTYLTRMKRGRWGINAFYRTLLSYVWWWNTLHGRTMDRRERRRRRRSDGHPCNVRSVTTYENMCVFFYIHHTSITFGCLVSLSLSLHISRAHSIRLTHTGRIRCSVAVLLLKYTTYSML